ncbi:hypothetical protein ACPZ19_36845 [Amycolatopsis lurida]
MAGGYTFDADAMADRIRQLEDVRARIQDQSNVLLKRAWIDLIEPPSGDGPAIAQVEATLASIRIAAEHNRAMYEYADAYLEKLYEVAERYGLREDESTGALFEK